jgi:hypothetical protein
MTTRCDVIGCDNVVDSLRWCRSHASWHRDAGTIEYWRRLREAGCVPIHGTRSRYRRGCRCSSCTAAERDYRRQYRARQATR